MRNLKSNRPNAGALWARFNELSAMSDAERQKVYHLDGMAFLSSLMATAMTNYTIPEIDSAEEFSEFIVESRENYRHWNQRLMSIMLAFEADKNASNLELLQDFLLTSPWLVLVEAAKNFVDLKSG